MTFAAAANKPKVSERSICKTQIERSFFFEIQAKNIHNGIPWRDCRQHNPIFNVFSWKWCDLWRYIVDIEFLLG